MRSAGGVFTAFLKLGCTSFGGPIAHLGYFRREFVDRRGWLSDAEYADLVALCQFLPGPTSSQTGFAIGLRHAGLAGGLAAFAGFTLPSALLLAAAGAGLGGLESTGGWLLGLKALAVAVVLQALYAMASSLTATVPRALLALGIAVALLTISRGGFDSTATALAQPLAIALGAALGLALLGEPAAAQHDTASDAQARSRRFHLPRALSALALLAFLGALLLAQLAAGASPPLRAGAACASAGALVFGGGHVVLPLLASPFVEHAWLTQDQVLAGYSLAQAVPGPLFTMTAFFGAAMNAGAGVMAALGAGLFLVLAVFLPGLLLVLVALPTWHALQGSRRARAALAGANAAVVGVLGAALADAVIPAGIRDLKSLMVAAACTLLVFTPRIPLAAVVLFGAVAGWLVLR